MGVTTAKREPASEKRIGWFARHGLWPSRNSATVPTEDWFSINGRNEGDVRLLYEKTFGILSIFLDWRHKSMSLGFGVIAAAVALDEWLFVHSREHWPLAAPLLVAAAFCLVVRRFDIRNQTILNDAYQVGAALERELGATNGAMMQRIPQKRPLWTYHETIKVVFGWLGLACFVAALASIVWSIVAAVV